MPTRHRIGKRKTGTRRKTKTRRKTRRRKTGTQTLRSDGKSVRIGSYTYQLSPLSTKKLMTRVKGKTIHFGQLGYQHYYDKTGLLPTSMNHRDPGRRKNYLSRSGGILGRFGNTKNNPMSANYHARRILW